MYYVKAADWNDGHPSDANTHATFETGTFGAGSYAETASGLGCGTDYYFLAIVSNSVDSSGLGLPPVSFHTASCTDMPASSSGGGGSSSGSGSIPMRNSFYVCTDPSATNYHTVAGIGNTSCRYAVPVSSASPAVSPVSKALGSGACSAALTITENLRQGDRDGRMSKYSKRITRQASLLQRHINRILAASYKQAAGPTDGIFGVLTTQGVKRLQVALNAALKPAPLLQVDGIVGSFTKAAINNSCGGM